MGGICLIFPTNFSRLASTSSRLTWRHGATRTRDPSQSYVSVSHPNKHVVLYSFHKFHCSYSKKKKRRQKNNQHFVRVFVVIFFYSLWCSWEIRWAFWFLSRHRSLNAKMFIVHKENQVGPQPLTQNTISQRIQRATLPNFHCSLLRAHLGFLLTTRRWQQLEFLCIDE